MNDQSPLIRVTALRKRYAGRGGEVRALDGVDLEFERGTFTTVRGPSGCGKSTLLLTIGGMLRPTSGTVTIEGKDLYAMSRAERARVRADRIGFVFQLFHLVPYLDVRENVRLGAIDGESDQAADVLLAELGMATRASHRPAELSAGERQRVALARALVAKPALILADEPTGNLDPDTGVEVLEHLASYRDGGGTVIMVTHGPDGDRFADRAVRIEAGKVVADDRETGDRAVRNTG